MILVGMMNLTIESFSVRQVIQGFIEEREKSSRAAC